MEDARSWVQEVSKLLVVDLQERCFNVELFVSHRHLLPHVSHRLEEKAIVLIW
jgi:hypothetical protein